MKTSKDINEGAGDKAEEVCQPPGCIPRVIFRLASSISARI